MRALAVADLQRDRLGLVAAGPPLTPPREWFEVPEPEAPSDGTWTVTADGQVYGYAALWDSCHTGKPGRCVKPPRSSSQYGYYMTGLTEVDDGELIPTGRITLGTGHASLTASPAATAEHYDNTGAVAADVRITDGQHGIWVSGALRPDVTPERARELRGASLSGDWRNIRGKLEMLGLLAVNVPGFPVPRTMTASGEYEGHEEVMALVAAGVIEGPLLLPEQLDEISDEEFEAGLQNLMDAMQHSEAMTAAIDPVEAALATFPAAVTRYTDTGGGERMADVTAAGFFDESKHPRKGKGEKGGGQWTVKTTNALGETSEHSFSEATAKHDYTSVRDRNAHVVKGELVNPEGKTVSKFNRDYTVDESRTPASGPKKFGSVRPGDKFTHQGKEYMKQRGSFATLVGGKLSEGIHLDKSTPVEVTDTSLGLTRKQLRET